MPDTPENGSLTHARENGRPPRDELVRAVGLGGDFRALEIRSADNGMPTLYGHFTPFNRWTEIDSWFEGNFLERIAPGAFKKTFSENTPKVLFQHGGDPQIGDKVLGPPDVLREEDFGPYYEVPLLDTSYNRDLVPGLEKGLYGASFRFSIMREDWVQEPGVSEYNPKGLPERTVREARVPEFGPVTFPAYADATAGVRSLTDEFLISRATRDPVRLRRLLAYLEQRDKTGHAGSGVRMDSEDAGTLAQMLVLASCYVDEQDEQDTVEAANRVAMQAIQASIITLLNVEAVEDEPDEPEEDERSSSRTPAPATTDAAPGRTSEGARRDPATRPTTDYLSPKEHKPSWHL
jgi:HK97 family phage prohead protease